MALSSKITTLYIRKQGYGVVGDWRYQFTINNGAVDFGQVNFTEAFDEALDGSLRSNIRGFRLTLTLNWAKLLNTSSFDTATVVKRTIESVAPDPFSELDSTSTIDEFLGDAVSAFVTDGDSYMDISFNTTFDSDTWRRVVFSESSLRTAITNQISRGQSDLTLVGQTIQTTIPTELVTPNT